MALDKLAPTVENLKTLLIHMPRLKEWSFAEIGLKFCHFNHKIAKSPSAGSDVALRPPASHGLGFTPRPPKQPPSLQVSD